MKQLWFWIARRNFMCDCVPDEQPGCKLASEYGTESQDSISEEAL